MHHGSTPFTTPFSSEIMHATRTRKVKILNLGLYDGTTDPEEHLGVYKV